MARRVSWTNNSSGHSGTYVYRAPTLDPQNLPEPVATVDPVAPGATAEWVDNEELAAGDYDYAVQDFDGQGVGALSAVTVHTVAPSLSNAQIGDEIEGGIYAGVFTNTQNNEQWHLISSKQDADADGPKWGNYGTSTGANDDYDGLANQQLILTSFDNGDSFAFYHCRDYVDAEGNSDYYMPSLNELIQVRTELFDHPEFNDVTASGEYVWASTEATANNAWLVRFASVNNFSGTKNYTTKWTRPVRRVPV